MPVFADMTDCEMIQEDIAMGQSICDIGITDEDKHPEDVVVSIVHQQPDSPALTVTNNKLHAPSTQSLDAETDRSFLVTLRYACELGQCVVLNGLAILAIVKWCKWSNSLLNTMNMSLVN